MSSEQKRHSAQHHPGVSPELNPGDEAPEGTPGTGENLCPDCSGKGKLNGQACDTCGGTGIVIEGIGGA
jgi:hypothetical protein